MAKDTLDRSAEAEWKKDVDEKWRGVADEVAANPPDWTMTHRELAEAMWPANKWGPNHLLKRRGERNLAADGYRLGAKGVPEAFYRRDTVLELLKLPPTQRWTEKDKEARRQAEYYQRKTKPKRAAARVTAGTSGPRS